MPMSFFNNRGLKLNQKKDGWGKEKEGKGKEKGREGRSLCWRMRKNSSPPRAWACVCLMGTTVARLPGFPFLVSDSL